MSRPADAGVGPAWRAGLGLALCLVAVYFPVLSNGYVWDDRIYFESYPADVYFSAWWADGREPFTITGNYFRPIAMLSFLADFAAGPSAAASHLINLLLHVANALLVGLLAWRLPAGGGGSVSPWTAAAAGLWYGLHPALIEPAAMVMCRFDLLATLFSIVLLHVSLNRARWTWPAITVLFLAALLSKENAAGLLIAWPLWAIASAQLQGARGPAIGARVLRGWCALGAGLLLCIGLRVWARGHAWEFGSALPEGGDYLGRVAMSLAQQIRLMVLPFGAVDPFHVAAAFSPLSAWVALLVVTVAAGCAIRPAQRPWAALFLAGVATLAPTSNVIPIAFAGSVYTADRYLTLPLVFLGPVVAALVHALRARELPARRLATFVLVVWVLAATLVVRGTLPLLKDDVRFWTWVSQLHPRERVPRNNLADALVTAGQPRDAVPVLMQALNQDDRNPLLWHNLARAHRDLGQLARAFEAIDRALALAPHDAHLWHTKATLFAHRGELDVAERILRQQVLAPAPALVDAHLNLLRILLATDRRAEAIAHVESQDAVLVGAWRERALDLLAGRSP